jgi:hypothetical protein
MTSSNVQHFGIFLGDDPAGCDTAYDPAVWLCLKLFQTANRERSAQSLRGKHSLWQVRARQ